MLNKINLTSTIIIVLAFVIGMALGEASIYVGALYICLSLVSAVLFNSQCKKTKVLEEKKLDNIHLPLNRQETILPSIQEHINIKK